jgi:hypothetical protein
MQSQSGCRNAYASSDADASNGSSQLFVRGNAGKQSLSSLELRHAFLHSLELEKKIRDFRDGRLAKVLSNDLFCR